MPREWRKERAECPSNVSEEQRAYEVFWKMGDAELSTSNHWI
jgi:hypothetical protein